MSRVLVTGGAGFGNAGDEALLLSAVQVVRAHSPDDTHLTVVAADAALTRATLGPGLFDMVHGPRQALYGDPAHYRSADAVFRTRWHLARDLMVGVSPARVRERVAGLDLLDFVDRPRMLAFLDALEQADALVVHGGGILTSATRSRLWEHALTIELAKSWGKRVLLRSHQFGPFDDEEDRERARTIAQCADFLTTRDKGQSSAVLQALVPGIAFSDQVDDALRLALEPAPAVLARHGLTPRGYICVSMRHNPRVGIGDDAARAIKSIVRMARRRLGLPVVLLPLSAPDAVPLDRLGRRLGRGDRPLVLDDPFRDPIMIAASARLMISSPHHSLIFALRGGVPVLSPVSGDYYRFKNAGSMRFFGLEDAVIDIEAAGWRRRVAMRLAEILDEGDAIFDRLGRVSAGLVAQSRATDAHFARALGHALPMDCTPNAAYKARNSKDIA
ncbi:polysaccharide pyruvyl transferase family protein [Sphingomonas sp. CJ20]